MKSIYFILLIILISASCSQKKQKNYDADFLKLEVSVLKRIQKNFNPIISMYHTILSSDFNKYEKVKVRNRLTTLTDLNNKIIDYDEYNTIGQKITYIQNNNGSIDTTNYLYDKFGNDISIENKYNFTKTNKLGWPIIVSERKAAFDAFLHINNFKYFEDSIIYTEEVVPFDFNLQKLNFNTASLTEFSKTYNDNKQLTKSIVTILKTNNLYLIKDSKSYTECFYDSKSNLIKETNWGFSYKGDTSVVEYKYNDLGLCSQFTSNQFNGLNHIDTEERIFKYYIEVKGDSISINRVEYVKIGNNIKPIKPSINYVFNKYGHVIYSKQFEDNLLTIIKYNYY